MPSHLRQLIMTNNAKKETTILYIRIGGLKREFGGTDIILSISYMPSIFVEGNQYITT